MNEKIIKKIISNKKKYILATIIEVEGSSPRHKGGNMLVSNKGIESGTIGGGELENNILEKIKKIFIEINKEKKNQINQIIEFDMNKKNIYEKGMLCGGKCKIMLELITEKEKNFYFKINKFLKEGKAVEISKNLKTGEVNLINSFFINKIENIKIIKKKKKFFHEIILPNETIVLFGAGYINKAVYEMALFLDFNIIVVDDREEFANFKRFSKAKIINLKKWKESIKKLYFNKLIYIVIATKSHLDDIEVLRNVINKPFFYLGCIGSKIKIKTIKEGLLKEGYDVNFINKIHAPIGFDIGAETPNEIAISILAQIIGERNEKKKNFV